MQSLAQRRLNNLQEAQGEEPPMQTLTQKEEEEEDVFFEIRREQWCTTEAQCLRE